MYLVEDIVINYLKQKKILLWWGKELLGSISFLLKKNKSETISCYLGKDGEFKFWG